MLSEYWKWSPYLYISESMLFPNFSLISLMSRKCTSRPFIIPIVCDETYIGIDQGFIDYMSERAQAHYNDTDITLLFLGRLDQEWQQSLCENKRAEVAVVER